MTRTRSSSGPQTKSSPGEVNVVVRALDILDVFERVQTPLSMMAVVHETGLHKATAFRLLTTLVQDRVLSQTETGEYELGLYALERAAVVRKLDELWSKALPLMRGIRDRTNESVVLTRRIGDECFDLDFVEASTPVVQSPAIGLRVPLHENTGGLIMLSHETADELLHYLRKQEDKGGRRAEVEAAMEVGRSSVGAGIRDEGGALVASVWLSIAPGRNVDSGELTAIVRRACEELNSSAAFSPIWSS